MKKYEKEFLMDCVTDGILEAMEFVNSAYLNNVTVNDIKNKITINSNDTPQSTYDKGFETTINTL